MAHCVYAQKELGDRRSSSIDFVRQLLPLPKMFCEVIMSEYVHGGSGESRSGGSTHKGNNDGDQRKQVSERSNVFHCLCFIRVTACQVIHLKSSYIILR